MSNALVKKTGIYFIGNIASKAMMAIIIPVYAFFVTPSAVGNYDYWLSLAQTASPVLFFAIWEAVLKFLISNDDKLFYRKAKGTVLVFSLIMVAVAVAFVATAVCFFGFELHSTASITSMCISFGLFQIWQYFARSAGKTRAYAISGVIASLITFALIVVLVCVLALQEFGLVVSYIGGQLVALLYLERHVRLVRLSNMRLASASCLRSFLAYSTPCVFNLIAGTLTLTVGRALIVNMLGADANGLYAFALKFANIVTALGGIFSLAVIEEGILRSRNPGAGDFYTHVSSALLMILLSVACMGLPAISLFYDLIDGTEYSSSIVLIPFSLLYAVCAVMSTQFGSVFMATGKTANQALTTIAGLILATAVSVLLIAPLGLVGAMGGLVLGTFGMAALRFVLARKQISFCVKSDGSMPLVILFCVLVAVMYLTPFGGTCVCHFVLLLVACVVSAPLFVRAVKAINSVPDL